MGSSSQATSAPAVTPSGIPLQQESQLLRDLDLGSEGADVQLLQQFLNYAGYTVSTEGPGSMGQESNYFGMLTRRL